MIPSECGCSRVAAEAAKVVPGRLLDAAFQAKSHPVSLSIGEGGRLGDAPNRGAGIVTLGYRRKDLRPLVCDFASRVMKR